MKVHAKVLFTLFAGCGFLIMLLALPATRVNGSASPPPATLTVRSNADAGGSCPGASCTLRQAIAVAIPGDTIDFDPSVTSITLASELAIDKNLTIQGPGASLLTLSGNHAVRVFNIGSVTPAINVTISGLTITNGRHRGVDGDLGTNGFGGGILNNSTGTLTISNAVISGNSAIGGDPIVVMSAFPVGGNGTGGGIYNASTGTINLTNSAISGNVARGGSPAAGNNGFGGQSEGGGILNSSGTVNLTNSTLAGNSATNGNVQIQPINGPGGGITFFGPFGAFGGGISNFGMVNITNSTISNNSANAGMIDTFGSGSNFIPFGSSGGGIFNEGILNVTNSTLFGNLSNGGSNRSNPAPPGCVTCAIGQGPGYGGGIVNFSGQVTLTNCTIAGNTITGVTAFNGTPSSTGNGGGVANLSDFVVNSKNTIIAGNTADVGPDVNGTLTSQGYNLIGNNKDATIIPAPGTADLIGTNAAPINPLLGPLANNGGPTFTMALLAGSPAIDKGAAAIDPISGLPITTDQRGLPRPNDSATIANALGGNGSDIGAFEVQCSFTCPPNQTAIAGANTCATVTYPPPTTSGSCGASVTCLPPSGTCFALGTSTVTCMEMDGSGGMAQCSFTVTVTTFDVCLQDDSDSRVVLLLNSTTGDYLFCGAGTPFSGRGQVTKKGSTLSFEHSPTDRRVTANVDGAVHRGKASLQSPAGTLRYTINDRDTTNNTCLCGAK